MADDPVKKSMGNLPGPGPGRPKGVPNKLNAALKEMILEALEESGGVAYLVKQADANPTAFLTLVGKVLPMTVAGDPSSPLRVELTKLVREVVRPDHKDG